MENLAILLQVICDYMSFNWPRFQRLLEQHRAGPLSTPTDQLDTFWREYIRVGIIPNMTFATPWLEDELSDVRSLGDLYDKYPNFMAACGGLSPGDSLVIEGDLC